MKKFTLLLLLTALPLLAFADVRIGFDELPEKAKAFVNAHFKNYSVLYVEKDTEDNEYEVKFNSDADITFDMAGEWKVVDPGKKKFPQSILKELPPAMVDYIKKNYSIKSISEVKRWNGGYEADISATFGDVDLYFDKDGNFTGKDK